ncbi:MAG: ABC transporter ATP-binding protein [Planctomycetota bacterium]|nr:ABC transporter ATP-binding protein [Planctomycetota bacterium]
MAKRGKFRWMLEIWKQVRWRLAIVTGVTLVYTAFMIATPYIFKLVIDGVQQGISQKRIVEYVYILLATGVGAGVMYFVLQANRVWVNTRVEWIVRSRVFAHVCRMGPSFFNRFSSGDIVTRLTDDLPEKIGWFACSGVFRLFEGLMLFAFALAAMLTLNWKLTLLALIPMPLLGILFRSVGGYFHRRYEKLQKLLTRSNDVLEAAVSGIRVVKAYCREQYHRELFDSALEKRVETEVSLVKVQSIFHILGTVLGEIGMIIVVWVGGAMIIKGTLAIGDLVAFNAYLLMLIGPMWTLGMFFQTLKRAEVSIGRIMELEDAAPEVVVSGPTGERPAGASVAGTPAEPATGTEVAFSDVTYAYPPMIVAKEDADDKKAGDNAPVVPAQAPLATPVAQMQAPTPKEEAEKPVHAVETKSPPAVAGLTFSVLPGRRIGIAGKVGSGKSTVLWLIPRLMDPDSGGINVDNVNLKELDLPGFRRSVGLVPQDSFLFSDTVRANIVFGRDWITDEDLRRAVSAAQLEGDLKLLPNGLDEKVGPRGSTLSGGQKQRVCVARALAGRPRVLILDDVTSNLDSETEAKFWETLERDWKDVTAFIVSHRLSTMARTDVVIAIVKGRIVEQGTHAELAARDSEYMRILKRQEIEM